MQAVNVFNQILSILLGVKARLQPFTVLFSFSAILVCFIDAQIHSCFREKIKQTKIALKEKSTVNGCKRALTYELLTDISTKRQKKLLGNNSSLINFANWKIS